ADQARQALGAAGARDDAELDLRQAECGFLSRDAAVAGECDLAAAAECGAIDRRDDGLGEILDTVEDLGKRGLHRRLAEFPDIGAADEDPARAGDDDRLDIVTVGRRRKRLSQSLAHMCRGGIDGRIVDRDDENALRDIARHAFRKPQPIHQPCSGMTAVAWISILARSSTSATTCMAAMAGKWRPITSR